MSSTTSSPEAAALRAPPSFPVPGSCVTPVGGVRGGGVAPSVMFVSVRVAVGVRCSAIEVVVAGGVSVAVATFVFVAVAGTTVLVAGGVAVLDGTGVFVLVAKGVLVRVATDVFVAVAGGADVSVGIGVTLP